MIYKLDDEDLEQVIGGITLPIFIENLITDIKELDNKDTKESKILELGIKLLWRY